MNTLNCPFHGNGEEDKCRHSELSAVLVKFGGCLADKIRNVARYPHNRILSWTGGRAGEDMATDTLAINKNQQYREFGMSSLKEVFADGIGEITLAGGMVRMDLVSMAGSQNDSENQPRLEPKQRSRHAARWIPPQL